MVFKAEQGWEGHQPLPTCPNKTGLLLHMSYALIGACRHEDTDKRRTRIVVPRPSLDGIAFDRLHDQIEILRQCCRRLGQDLKPGRQQPPRQVNAILAFTGLGMGIGPLTAATKILHNGGIMEDLQWLR